MKRTVAHLVALIGPANVGVALMRGDKAFPHIGWRIAAAVCLALVVAKLIALIRPLFLVRMKRQAPDAAGVVHELRTTLPEFSLLLRPFGRDNMLSQDFAVDPWDYLLLKPGCKWSSWEEEIAGILEKHGHGELIALLDERSYLLPKRPRYIRATNTNWQFIVFELIKRARTVIFMIHERQRVTDALAWEVSRAVQLGLIDRMIILLVPENRKDQQDMVASIKKRLYFLPGMDDIGDDLLTYSVEGGDMPHITAGAAKTNVSETNITLATYARDVEAFSKRVDKALRNTKRAERYPYLAMEYDKYEKLTLSTLGMFHNKPWR